LVFLYIGSGVRLLIDVKEYAFGGNLHRLIDLCPQHFIVDLLGESIANGFAIDLSGVEDEGKHLE